MKNVHSQQIVSLEELSRRLKLSKAFIRREAKAGRIPWIRAGRRRVFNAAAVEAAIARQAAEGTTAEGGGK